MLPVFTKDQFLSGERFQALADISVATKQVFLNNLSLDIGTCNRVAFFNGDNGSLVVDAPEPVIRLRHAKVIYVYTHLMRSFMTEILPYLEHSFVLMSDNSIQPITDEFLPLLDDKRVAKWFSTNIDIDHPKLVGVPLGVANAQWQHGDLEALAKAAASGQEKQDGVYMNFDPTTNQDKRGAALAALADKDFIHRAEPKDFPDYLMELAGYRYCISPPGKGIDCHRHWESLYVGCLPIVQDGLWRRDFRNIPMIALEDWADITPAYLERAEKELFARDDLCPEKLTVGYWKNRINAEVKAL